MTVFTKKDATEEKPAKEEEPSSPPVPKVVVSGLSPQESEERDISNCGWKPMEGGNFDRPKEKRSSSFGPLSIIRLSPSPLARTPSPSPPEYENMENERRFRRYAKYSVVIFILVGLAVGTGLFFYQKSLLKSAYQRGVYHGWNAATYNSNRGVAERLEQNVEVNTEQDYEKIDVPRFGSNRPAVFVHDFKQNLTGIVDVMGKRCFLKPLDRSVVAAPSNLIQMLRNMESPISNSPRVVRETFRVGQRLSEDEVTALGSTVIIRNCATRPVYMLQKTGESDVRRSKRDVDQALEFASLTAGNNVEVDAIFV